MMMDSTRLNGQQARAIAFIVNAIRPDWDQAGIVAALGRARDMGDLATITVAAVRAATNPRNLTPAVIHMQGTHWAAAAGGGVSTNPLPHTVEPCPVHGLRPAHACPSCRSDFLALGKWPEGTKHHEAAA